MQATKPLSPVKSKQPAGSNNKEAGSLAQRVMEVTTSREQTVVATGSGKSALKKPLVSSSGSDNNSVKSSVNDHEVESITNRANKIDLGQAKTTTSTTSSTTSSSSSPSTSANVTTKKQKARPSPTSSILHPQNNEQQQQQQPQKHNFHNHNHHHHIHKEPNHNRQLVSQSHQLKVTDGNSDLLKVGLASGHEQITNVASSRQPIISLDTKVPHPSGKFCDEEVSYYNETQVSNKTTTITNLLEPKQAGGSLDNNTKPRLLAAVATSKQQQLKQHQQTQHQIHAQQQQQQQRSQVALMAGLTSCQHLLRSNPYINDDQQAEELDRCQDDDDLLRYDNAQVERNLEAQRLNEQRLNEQRPAATSCPRHHHHQQVSISTSPKAKSAPATPCNVTPTAFHQSSTNLSSLMANPNCNTLPPDIRKNISATCRVLPSSLGVGVSLVKSTDCSKQTVNLKYLDSLSEQGERALQEKNYTLAVELLSQCISLANQQQLLAYLKKNFKVYSYRAEANLKLANYNEAIDDSMAARGLNPKWTQAYYLQGEAQFRIGQYADALAVFAFGLTHQESPIVTSSLFEALVDAASSYLPDGFKVKFQKLKALKLDTKPFIVVGLLGQELFATGHNEHAAIVLESALKINNLELASDHVIASPPSQQKKFKSSVLSTISAAYCKMRDYDKALGYMQRELDIESELEDVAGQCRVLANLGYTYFKVHQYELSLEVHRKQLTLAMKLRLFKQASQALNALGHVHVARNNYTDALTSHDRCLSILKQLGDNHFDQFREILAIGHIHSQLGDLRAAERKYNDALQLLKTNCKQQSASERDEWTIGSIMANFNLAYLALKKQNFQEAEQYYNSVLKLTKTLSNQNGWGGRRFLYEMRASNGLGQTCRLMKRFDEAHSWFEEQLQLAKTAQCKLGQSQALCNLGMIQQHFKSYHRARHLFEENLKLVDTNLELKAYAHSYLGSTYFLMGRFSDSKLQYEASLNLFSELTHCRSERKTIEINLALVQERLSGGSLKHSPESLLHQSTNGNPSSHSKKVMLPAT